MVEATHQSEKCPSHEASSDIETSSTTSKSSLGLGTVDCYLTFATDIPLSPAFPSEGTKDYPQPPDLHRLNDPLQWSLTYKRCITFLLCAVNVCACYAVGSYLAPEKELIAIWSISKVAFRLGFAIFTASMGIAPMILAPVSEVYGRRPVFVVTGIIFVIAQLGCALSNSLAGLLVSRLFAGIGCSSFTTMVGGVFADIWLTADRSTSMALLTGSTLVGTGLGALISSVIAQRLFWRWVFYVQTITCGVFVTLVIIFFRETRASIISARKAKLINDWYTQLEEHGAVGMWIPPSFSSEISPSPTTSTSLPTTTSPQIHRIRFKAPSTTHETTSLTKMITTSLSRPILMLLTEPVVFFFSLWITFALGTLFLTLNAIPLIYQQSYNFTQEQTGLIFTAMIVAGILAVIVAVAQEKIAGKYYPQKMTASPEGRLMFTCYQAALLPIGCFWFGFTCSGSTHWIVPTIAIAVSILGISSVFIAVFNYTADVYMTYASSALAAVGLARNLLAGCFPLVTERLFLDLGFREASFLLGGIGAALTIVPWVLVWKGEKIRARSRIASSFVQ